MQSQVKPHSVSIRRDGKNSDGLGLNWRARPAHDHPCALQVLGWRLPKVSKSAWQSGGKDVSQAEGDVRLAWAGEGWIELRHDAKTHAMARPRVRNKDGTSNKSRAGSRSNNSVTRPATACARACMAVEVGAAAEVGAAVGAGSASGAGTAWDCGASARAGSSSTRWFKLPRCQAARAGSDFMRHCPKAGVVKAGVVETSAAGASTR